ncbi:MAG: formate/nitrite transporter family protein [Rikenellaceae bacterium]
MRNPREIVAQINRIAVEKTNMPKSNIVVAGFLAGVYISIGALLSLTIGCGFPAIANGNPAIVRLMMGAVFPIGLIMIVVAGGELFTGNCAVLIPNLLSGRSTLGSVLRNWAIVLPSNMLGTLFFGYLFVNLMGVTAGDAVHNGLYAIAEAKTSNPFWITFVKGIGANWLVCLAVWMSNSDDSVSSKMLAMWFPIMAFVAVGFEHSIANMFFLPVAMLEGYDITVWQIITKNLVPAILGNIVGGSLFVGGLYWFLYDESRMQKRR